MRRAAVLVVVLLGCMIYVVGLLYVVGLGYAPGPAEVSTPKPQMDMVVPSCPKHAKIDNRKCKSINGDKWLYLCQDVEVTFGCRAVATPEGYIVK